MASFSLQYLVIFTIYIVSQVLQDQGHFSFISPSDRSALRVIFSQALFIQMNLKFLFRSKAISINHMGSIQSIQLQGMSFHLLPVSVQTSREFCAAPKSPPLPDDESSHPGPKTFSLHPMNFIRKQMKLSIMVIFLPCFQ